VKFIFGGRNSGQERRRKDERETMHTSESRT
jgi:hypothetical protein